MAAAVEALAETSPLPITSGEFPQQRFPGPVEAAGYFLIAAASQLAALAGANGITVEAGHDGNRLLVTITEHGGSEAGQQLEAGLVDVADRVGALGGQLHVGRVAGSAITIRAEIPCGS